MGVPHRQEIAVEYRCRWWRNVISQQTHSRFEVETRERGGGPAKTSRDIKTID